MTPVPEPELTSVAITPDPVEGAVEGTAIALTATADGSGSTTYAWEGTNGTFGNTFMQTVYFTPTAEGACTVKVTATEGDVSVTDEISFTAGASE